MVIRKIGENDIKDALSLVLRVFMEYEAPDYSDEGVETFKRTAIYNKDYIDSMTVPSFLTAGIIVHLKRHIK